MYNKYVDKTFRIVNDDDPVTMVPSAAPMDQRA